MSTYDSDQIRDLLARASRLQAAEKTPDGEGLTLDELKEVARESGIDPNYIELASTEGQLRTKSHWGMPARVSRERWVDGTLDKATWDQMKKRFSRHFGVGTAAFDVDEGTWDNGHVRIFVQQQGDQIHMQAEAGWESDFEMPMAFAIVSAIAALTTTGLAIVSLEWTIGLVAALFCTAVVLSVARFRKTKHERAEDESRHLDEALMQAAMLYVTREATSREATARDATTPESAAEEAIQSDATPEKPSITIPSDEFASDDPFHAADRNREAE